MAGDLLTVEQARRLTADANGKCIGQRAFYQLVREGVIPSWQNPLAPPGSPPRIPRERFLRWLNDEAPTHTPKTVRGAA